MEDEYVNRTDDTAPSDDLDAAIAAANARIEAARSAAEEEVDDEDEELDVDDDETTETETTVEDDPDDEDEEDEDTDEVDTPETTVKPTKQTRKESQQKTKGADEDTTDEDENSPKLSRKQRGKLIEELRQELEAKEKERKELEAQMAQQKLADEELNKEVNRALGTDEELEKALEEGLKGDKVAAEKARIWKANREFYKKLLSKSKQQAAEEFTSFYWKDIQDFPGVDKKVLAGESLNDVLKHLYDAGTKAVEEKAANEIAKLKEEVQTWKGRYRALKPKAGSQKKAPISTSGGATVADEQPFDWRKKYIDPRTGLLTDEADAIIARYGMEGLKNPKLAKGR